MYVDAEDISGLSAHLYSPEHDNPSYPWYGPPLIQGHADLFDHPMDYLRDEHCTKEDLMANFYDGAPNSAEAFHDGDLCRTLTAPSVFSEIEPQDTFAHAFNGKKAYGDWELKIKNYKDTPFYLEKGDFKSDTQNRRG